MKSKGMFAFLAGMAAGATALFLSNEENRQKTKAGLNELKADPTSKLQEGAQAAGAKSKQLAEEAGKAVEQVLKPKKKQ